MAVFTSNAVKKKLRVRAHTAGRAEQVTSLYRVKAGTSIALADNIDALLLGENTRPVRVILHATPVSGTPVLTNATFNVGVKAASASAYTRPDGTSYAVPATAASQLAAAAVINADNMATVIEVSRPVADSVSRYAPFIVTVTPAGAGAFSVAGGDIDLGITLEFLGEANGDAHIYTDYVNQKVKN